MVFDSSFLVPLISGGMGLAGVWMGGRMVTRREEEKEKARVKSEAGYAAILIMAHLDRLITRCVELAFDDGTAEGRPAGSDYVTHVFTVGSPEFDPLAIDVDWKSLPTDLLHSILNLPYQIEVLDYKVFDILDNDDPPEHDETFWTRQIGYAELGLEISNVVKRLRRHAALPVVVSPGGTWDRETRLRDKKAEFERQREEVYARRVPIQFPGKTD
jgi:hypothetical protein